MAGSKNGSAHSDNDPEFPMVMVDDLPATAPLMTVRVYVNGVLDQTISDVDPSEDNTVNIAA